MKTAALLQLPGNPFILAYWLRNYERVWKSEVDELHVFVNGCKNAEILETDRKLVEAAGGRFDAQPGRMVHGSATQHLFRGCDADYVMLVEDDAFVCVSEAVASAIWEVQNGTVIGSPRGGMSAEVVAAARELWGPDPVGPDGSEGYGLWPCFLFGPRQQLANVLPGFPSRAWKPGEVIGGINRAFPDIVTTDTFTLSAFLLREHGLLGRYEGQWKELWLRDLNAARTRAGYNPPWFHAGGLSNEDYFNGGGALGARPNVGGNNEGNDWAHRIWWWRRCVETAPTNLLPDMQTHYHRKLDELTTYLDVHAEVEAWELGESAWISWDDQA